jgi:hypothetical protein
MRIEVDTYDLEKLNQFGADGWRPIMNIGTYLLLERRLGARDVLPPVAEVKPTVPYRGRMLEKGPARHGLA